MENFKGEAGNMLDEEMDNLRCPSAADILAEANKMDKSTISALFDCWRMLALGYACPAEDKQVYENLDKEQKCIREKILSIMPQNMRDLAMQLLIGTSGGFFAPARGLVRIAETLARRENKPCPPQSAEA